MFKNSQIHFALILHFEKASGYCAPTFVVFGFYFIHVMGCYIKQLLFLFPLLIKLSNLFLMHRLVNYYLAPDVIILEFKLFYLV